MFWYGKRISHGEDHPPLIQISRGEDQPPLIRNLAAIRMPLQAQVQTACVNSSHWRNESYNTWPGARVL